MRTTPVVVLLCCGLLSGCMTAGDKAAKQAYDGRPQLGVDFVPEWLTENDVIIQSVPSGTAAAHAGLLPKDQIVSFDGQTITSLHQLNQLELHAQHGQTVKLGILRDQRPMAMFVNLD